MTVPPPSQQPQQHPVQGQRLQGPPPGYQQQPGPPPGYAGHPTQLIQRAAPASTTKAAQLVWVLGVVSVVAVTLGLSLKEDGRNQWDSVNAWGGLAIAGALLTLAPAVGRSLGLTPQRAWQVAACGA